MPERNAASPPIHIALAGDSTVATYAPEDPTRGWGQWLPEFFTGGVRFSNQAMGGRSSRSFRDEGHWQQVLALRPDWVFIQFGHNDQPGKGAERETDPATTYAHFLRAYVRETHEIGAKAILVTPPPRRIYGENGGVRRDLVPYAEAMRAVALETGTPFINSFDALAAIYEARGDEASIPLTVNREDMTHFSEAGARLLAGFIAEGVFEAVPELRPYRKR